MTLIDASETVVRQRLIDKPFRMPVSGEYKIKGVSDIITGCAEQGEIAIGVDVRLYPSGVERKPFIVEMHHKNVTENVNVKGFTKGNMPRVGDKISTEDSESDPNPSKSYAKFAVLVIVLDHDGQLKCSQHDTKSDGYQDVYLCRIWTLTGNVMFDKIESFRSLAGAVAIYVLIENISIPLLLYI